MKKKLKIQEIVEDVRANQLEHYEVEEFNEDAELADLDVEEFEEFQRLRGRTAQRQYLRARHVARTSGRSRNVISPVKYGKTTLAVPRGLPVAAELKAQFDIKVRVIRNEYYNLPYLQAILFGIASYESDFSRIDPLHGVTRLSREWATSTETLFDFCGVSFGYAMNKESLFLLHVKTTQNNQSAVREVGGEGGGRVRKEEVGQAITEISCEQVPYLSLLKRLSSDNFRISGLRISTKEGKETQFNNAISIFKQSLFGREERDKISPSSYLSPEQLNKQIVDIPIIKDMDAFSSLYFNVNAPTQPDVWEEYNYCFFISKF